MSGPKVVRIVTREEVLDICNGLLARVDAALEEWLRVAARHECVDEETIAATRRRREALSKLIMADCFMELQKQAPIEESFLRNNVQALVNKVAAKQAEAQLRERREREAAVSLLRVLRAGNMPIDSKLEDRLKRGEADALSEGFRMLSETSNVQTASAKLASLLRDQAEPISFARWLASQPRPEEDPTIQKLELRIAELMLLVPEATASTWQQRLDEAAGADHVRRGLLIDGLEVETGRALTKARKRNLAASELNLLLAEADTAGMDTSSLRSGLDTLDGSAIAARVAEANASLEKVRSEASACARRNAILKELSALGYEVAEGMSTILAERGRLVLRNAARLDYGVEVSAANGSARMQMRAVAFDQEGSGSNPERDRDAETIWCGEVSTLQERLAEIGGGLIIEKALPVGATPLKRVGLKTDRQNMTEAPGLRERTLR